MREGFAVDKSAVKRSFGRSAHRYDQCAAVQRLAWARLLERALAARPHPHRVLDIGAGTGALLARLSTRCPGAILTGVDLAPGMVEAGRRAAPGANWAVGDAELLPLRGGLFDLVLSTSALQWLPRLGPALAEARRVTAPGGTVAIALFGGATLHELRGAWSAALPPGAPDRTHRFHGIRCLGAAAGEAGLTVEVLTAERVVERHAGPLDLLRALKRLGAGNASGGAAATVAGLGAGPLLARMATNYCAQHGSAEGVPATWEVLHLVARAPP